MVKSLQMNPSRYGMSQLDEMNAAEARSSRSALVTARLREYVQEAEGECRERGL